MEALVKFTKEGLDKKEDAQLRQILRREFQFSKGTSVMTKDQLVDQILTLVKDKKDVVEDNSGIDMALIHKDAMGNDWRIEKIENNVVYIKNESNFTTNIGLVAFQYSFNATKYSKFSSEVNPPETQGESVIEEEGVIGEDDAAITIDQPTIDAQEVVPQIEEKEVVKEDEVVPTTVTTPTPKVDEPKKDVPKEKTFSKSDLTRRIIREQYADPKIKMTSGTVMKALKEKHKLDIHRSFCSTLIAQYKKAKED